MRRRFRTARWVLLAFAVVVAVAVATVYLTAPRPGGAMDPESTSPEGTHALVSLLRDHGVEVITAHSVDEVQRAAGPGTLLVVAQTMFLASDKTVGRLAHLPGDLLLVAPIGLTREKLAPRSGPGRPRSSAAVTRIVNCPRPIGQATCSWAPPIPTRRPAVPR